MEGLLPFLIILFGARVTFALSSLRHWGPIRSSSFVSLVFVLVMKLIPYHWPMNSDILFFGGSFIGMSGVDRLSRFFLPFSCLLFYLFFYNVGPYIKGMGGGLGLGAFLSVGPLALVNYLLHLYRDRDRDRDKRLDSTESI